MIFGRKRKRKPQFPDPEEPMPNEQGVIDLLFAGDLPFFSALRAQVHEAGSCVSRYRRPEEYGIGKVFMGSHKTPNPATSAPVSYVDDLVVSDDRLGLLTVEAQVGHGELSRIVLRPLNPVDEWPLDGPRADAYGYRAEGEDPAAALGRTERDLSRWAVFPPPLPGPDPADAPAWLRKLMAGPPLAEPRTSPGASAADVRKAEAEAGFKLPTQYKQLVTWSNGVTLWDVEIAGTGGAYDVGGYLVFCTGSIDGSVCALDSGGAVWWGNAEKGEFEPFEDSLADWVAGIKDSAARAGG